MGVSFITILPYGLALGLLLLSLVQNIWVQHGLGIRNPWNPFSLWYLGPMKKEEPKPVVVTEPKAVQQQATGEKENTTAGSTAANGEPDAATTTGN